MNALVDERLAAHITEELAAKYAGVFTAQTVAHIVRTAQDLVAATAPVVAHRAVLSQRFADEQLRAAAQAEGLIAKEHPEVLFVCVSNAGRSQAAAALLVHYAGDRVGVRSAGTAPADDVNPAIAAELRDRGVDIGAAYPKPLTDILVRAADVVITMGCGDTCPVYPGRRYEDWSVPDPAGQPPATVRAIVDDIDERVRDLLAGIEARPAAHGDTA